MYFWEVFYSHYKTTQFFQLKLSFVQFSINKLKNEKQLQLIFQNFYLLFNYVKQSNQESFKTFQKCHMIDVQINLVEISFYEFNDTGSL